MEQDGDPPERRGSSAVGSNDAYDRNENRFVYSLGAVDRLISETTPPQASTFRSLLVPKTFTHLFDPTWAIAEYREVRHDELARA